MEYAGGLVKHLGLSMYRGPVPAIAELVANAWDAEADGVSIEIPFGVGLADREIRVRDTGTGMTWEQCQNSYLVVGRDRRSAEGDRTTTGRRVMGHKGIGKLAGFGIATLVEVRTVRDGWLTHFAMDFDVMTGGGRANLVTPYAPEIREDRATDEPHGTEIILSRLLITRPINRDEFHGSMARRFAVISPLFNVSINGEPLTADDVPLQFRYEGPDGGYEDVPGVGTIKWWMGFTHDTIKVDDARGIAVMTRGRMAQTPFFFNLTGGLHGQHGMQYMTGVIEADQLDEVQDLVGTDRQAIVWTGALATALLRWGQDKIRDLLGGWADLRTAANEEELLEQATQLNTTVAQRIAQLRPSEQREARKVVATLASLDTITEDAGRASEILDLVLRAFEDSSFFALLRAVRDINQEQRDELLKLITELDIFETVRVAELVRARVGVIRKFRQMIEADVPEKPDLQDFLFEHPYLINFELRPSEHERQLEQLVIERFGLKPDADPASDERIDFFCIGTRNHFLVVEVKRPGATLGQKEVTQILNYVSYLKEAAPTSGDPPMPNHFRGVLVGHHLSPDGRRWADEIAVKSDVIVRTWKELLDVAEREHKEMLELVIQRAPEDARIQAIPQLDEEQPTES
jgi:RecB family endonuclease NucS